jgi:hypothetical protein
VNVINFIFVVVAIVCIGLAILLRDSKKRRRKKGVDDPSK